MGYFSLPAKRVSFYQAHNTCYTTSLVHVIYKKKYLYLERRSLIHGGESPSPLVPGWNQLPFKPRALSHPCTCFLANRTFIYTQMRLTCPLLPAGHNDIHSLYLLIYSIIELDTHISYPHIYTFIQLDIHTSSPRICVSIQLDIPSSCTCINQRWAPAIFSLVRFRWSAI